MSKKTEICCKYDSQRSSIKMVSASSPRGHETNNQNLELMKPAPFWSGVAIKDSKLVNTSLNDYRDNYLVIIFYPYDFTIVCPTELLQFSDRLDEFEALNCKVVAVSTDSEFTHLAWSTTPRKQGGLGEMRVPMLSDKNHNISKSYGVYDSSLGISYRGLFVIDDKSIVRHVTINDIAIPRCVDEVLRVIEASKFVDKHGNICPMGPIEAPPEPELSIENSKQYFSTDLIKKTRNSRSSESQENEQP